MGTTILVGILIAFVGYQLLLLVISFINMFRTPKTT